VLLVDDVHQADDRSAAALARAAGHLPPHLTGLVLTALSGAALPGGLDTLPSVDLSGLNDEWLRALLGQHVAGTPPTVMRNIVALCDRNPVVLREVAESLTAEQLSGGAPLPLRPPLGPESLRVLSRPLSLLTDTQRNLLLLLAVAGGDATAALDAGGMSLDELAPAQRCGLVHVHGNRCRWNPPLLADTVVQSASTADLTRAVHALESVVGGADASLRRAMLAAYVAVGPATEALHEAVVTLTTVGRLPEAYEAAVAAIPRARDGRLRARFRTAAAELAWLRGYPDHAMDLLAGREPDEPDDGEAQVVRWAAEGIGEAWPVGGVVPTADKPSLAARLAGTALVAGWETTSPEELTEVLEHHTPAAQPAGVTALARIVGGHSLLSETEHVALRKLAWWTEPADALYPRFWPPPLLPVFIGEEVGYERYFSDLLDTAFTRGTIISRSLLLAKRAGARWATGRWSDALRDAQAGAGLADHARQPVLRRRALHIAAWIEASRGDWQAATRTLNLAGTSPVSQLPHLVWTRALAALGAGRADVAFDELDELHCGRPRSPHHLVLRRLSTVDLVTAAVRSRRADQARTTLAEFEAWVGQGAAPWARMDLARCRALLGGPDCERWYADALGLAPVVARPSAEARTRLEYGAWLRRTKRKREARIQLRTAETMFTELGAQEWSQLASAGLRATGEPSAQAAGGKQKLTAQEQRIAELAAEGLNNKQVADALKLSHRTVGYHLSKVYSKLQITSRAQLARAIDAER
jgi:DNA-binding CsgD family transcriptional regulator